MPSPIEEQFLTAWQRHFPNLPLMTEFLVYGGRYRIDFAFVPARIAVELDGYEYHSDRDRFTEDRQRDRALQRDGWRVLHFSGREIYYNVDACVQEVYTVITQCSSIPQPIFASAPQRGDNWKNKPLDDRDMFGKSRSGNSVARGCARAIYATGVLMLMLVALCMIFGGLTFMINI